MKEKNMNACVKRLRLLFSICCCRISEMQENLVLPQVQLSSEVKFNHPFSVFQFFKICFYFKSQKIKFFRSKFKYFYIFSFFASFSKSVAVESSSVKSITSSSVRIE